VLEPPLVVVVAPAPAYSRSLHVLQQFFADYPLIPHILSNVAVVTILGQSVYLSKHYAEFLHVGV